MPKVTSSAIQPLSGVFAIDKPSGAITMKLLNSMKELLETSPYFAMPDDPNQRYGHKKRRRGWGKTSGRGRAVGVVKLGQGGTLDPLASGVLGRFHGLAICRRCFELKRRFYDSMTRQLWA